MSRRPHSSPESPDRTVRISPSCCSRGLSCHRDDTPHEHRGARRIEHIVDDVEIVSGDLLDQSRSRRSSTTAPTSSTISRRSRSCRPPGASRCLPGVHGARRDARAGGDPRRRSDDPLLPGLQLRDVRKRRRDAADAKRRRSIRAAPTASRRSTATITVNYREWYDCSPAAGFFQSRIAAPRHGVRHAENLRRRRAHQARPGEEARPGKSRRASRLGIRRRLRARHVADAAAASPTITSSRPAERTACATSCGSLRSGRSRFYEPYVVIDPRFVRPAEVDPLIGDPSKAAADSVGSRSEFEELVADDGRGRPRPALGAPAGVSSEIRRARAGHRRQRFRRRPSVEALRAKARRSCLRRSARRSAGYLSARSWPTR